MKRLLLICMLGLWVPDVALSQFNFLKGKVLTEEAHEGHDQAAGARRGEPTYIPLPGAYVRWSHDEASTTVSDGFGFFKISKAEIGDTLVVSMAGFETVGWVYNGESYVDIPLKSGVELESAEVVEKKAATQLSLLSPLDVQSLNRKELVKAACCNLSEAFETNASVDASFTDAVTGTRQIRMLGLHGKYSQLQVDNMPGPRGLNVIKGLEYIPGDWVHAIHISKGAGSATQGYESITGQINVAMKNPETADPLHANVYFNRMGRSEVNVVTNQKVSRRWSTTVLLHGLRNERVNDRNGDGFLDVPLHRHLIGRNEWKFKGDRGIRGEYAITVLETGAGAGQTVAYEGLTLPETWRSLLDTTTAAWSAVTQIDRVEATAKTGYVFPDAVWRSIGTQWTFYDHRHTHRFGSNRYDGRERFFRGNILYADIIGNTSHSFTTGLSYVYNAFDEQLEFQVSDSLDLQYSVEREEQVPGIFAEYTWSGNERWSVIGGVRYDQHNLFGGMLSPRLHARWSVTENVSWKTAAGRGFRTPNPFMEQLGTWASQRQWYWGYDSQGLQPEIATNIGTNLTSKFRLNYREASLTLDAYSTRFENKLVVDLDQATNAIHLYNLSGSSFANTAQVEFNWDMHRRWDVRLAYRWVNAHTDRILGNPTEDPFVSKHRGFSQISYASQLDKHEGQWRADVTFQWIGAHRLPTTAANPEPFIRPDYAPDFYQLNAQLTRQFTPEFSVYLGVENALNYKQDRPIIGADYGDNPVAQQDFNQYFDASLVYGPIFGRMFYAGLRWGILPPKKNE